ncbi:DNA repair and recombination protein, putative helicase [Sporocytophaga myxococcoides]|uniref:DNA repair and recombination protein, putative helicase n=1 Tax=Sporocytophaga myxococcoides TaxID=153721 RepID=A0A098LMF8_9BACT|nr:helix-turn-helix domain-containing protein [Sporocytophaga myxococcoides]GAL87709.1 DNA repair and recombination protein, putative helicase [Sporocytophaga myxococcoides]
MKDANSTNPQFELAVQFVNNTSQNIFLTGKAGTGKTTFLKHIKQHSHKKLAVVAPTGIAAINAGGVTVHSFFQLPFGSFLPLGSNREMPEGNFFNHQMLLKQLRFGGMKRRLLLELELLIIDEVSMLRSDLLDAIDLILKQVRKTNAPFGGVQLVFIGDLLQLPPVIKEEDWAILKKFYTSPFFFDSHVLRTAPPQYLELKKIYRQTNEVFIDLLNRLRNDQVLQQDLDLLNSYYRPEFKPQKQDEYITLTTHNRKAEEINQRELNKLDVEKHIYKAEIKGDFNEKTVTAEVELLLKEGAQIMFIRNDKGENKKFYNGKLGIISKLEQDTIYVSFSATGDEIKIEKETWNNVRYNYNKETDAIEEEVLGSFTQYPLRLAWAITIHKSQGLTFSKAIVDAGESFAPGQVYVALSRLTSLEGLVLYSKIRIDSINTDQHALNFSLLERDEQSLHQDLKDGEKQYVHAKLFEVFNFASLSDVMEQFHTSMFDRRLTFLDEATELAKRLLEKAKAMEVVSEKFVRQMEQLLKTASDDKYTCLKERVDAAGKYFLDTIKNELVIPLEQHYENVKNLKKVKQYLQDLNEVSDLIKRKNYQLEQAMQLTTGLATGSDPGVLLKEVQLSGKNRHEVEKEKSMIQLPGVKAKKGDTHRLSLELFRQGKSIELIAEERGLNISTIEGHLASFILTGEVAVGEIVKEDKIKDIVAVIEEMGDMRTALYKDRLGENYSYSEIKAVLNWRDKNREQKPI